MATASSPRIAGVTAGFRITQVTPNTLSAALDLHQTRSIGFYDAIIVTSAQTSGCAELLSEDFNSGEVMHGVRIRNPFANN